MFKRSIRWQEALLARTQHFVGDQPLRDPVGQAARVKFV